MALWVLDDHGKYNSYQRALKMADHIITYLKRKKTNLKLVYDLEGFERVFQDPEAVFCIPTDVEKAHLKLIRRCNAMGIPVIAVSGNVDTSNYYFSSINSNVGGGISIVLSYLLQYGRRRIAFFGAKTSLVDMTKVEKLYNLYPDFNEKDIFYTTTCVEDTFKDFFEYRHEYDAVICSNDMCAIYLLERLKETDPEYIPNTFFISFMNSVLSRVYHYPITSLSYDRDNLPSVILHMYKSIVKNRNAIDEYNVMLKSEIFVKESTHLLPFDEKAHTELLLRHKRRKQVLVEPDTQNDIVSDPMIEDLLSIEAMFLNAEPIDLNMTLMFLQGNTNDEVCQNLFVSLQTVKYRSALLFEQLGVNRKKAFVEKISKFVDIKRFEEYVASVTPPRASKREGRKQEE